MVFVKTLLDRTSPPTAYLPPGPVPGFTLTESRGQSVTRADLMFTSCGDTCPILTMTMSRLDRALGPRADLRLVSTISLTLSGPASRGLTMRRRGGAVTRLTLHPSAASVLSVRRLSLILTHLAVIAALAVGSGAHWIALQSVAWATMLVDYSREASLVVAVERTFDGEHPCALCLTVKDGERQQKNQQAAQPVPAIKGILAPVLRVTSPTFVFTSHPRFEEAAERLVHSPPVPPPRLA